jgi:hypothetical protein
LTGIIYLMSHDEADMPAEAGGVLVLTDSESVDEQDLYPASAPSGGATSVSIPLSSDLYTSGDLTIQVQCRARQRALGSLWSGPLSLPSGVLLASDWSMRPLVRYEVPAGDYQVAVDLEGSKLIVSLEPAAD